MKKRKALLSGIFAAGILLTSTAFNISASGQTATEPSEATGKTVTLTYGDVDNDGHINSADSLLVLRNSVDLEWFDENQKIIADVDIDKKVTSADALEILRYSVGFKTTGKTGQKITLTESTHTHTWVEKTEQKQQWVEPKTQVVEKEVQIAPDVQSYTIVWEKCKICGQRVIFTIFQSGRDVASPDSSKYPGYRTTHLVQESDGTWHYDYDTEQYIRDMIAAEPETFADFNWDRNWNYWYWEGYHVFNCKDFWREETQENVLVEIPGTGGTEIVKETQTIPGHFETVTVKYRECATCGKKEYY